MGEYFKFGMNVPKPFEEHSRRREIGKGSETAVGFCLKSSEGWILEAGKRNCAVVQALGIVIVYVLLQSC